MITGKITYERQIAFLNQYLKVSYSTTDGFFFRARSL